MATISASTYNDAAARTAGEAITINTGAVWTIRTDTRWHANAPASMTGSLASINVTEGECLIDGRNVRWLAYTGGSGTVPAIGTTVSQGGVSGYMLGVWSSLTSAPTAVGAAMPATGFIKFREVTGGTFSAGALTGITATASGADVPGWIEVVLDQSGTITVPRLGKWTVRGSWFDLGTTTGTVGQVIQTPTNGGGAGTYVPAVWIEDAIGSGTYEMYTALNGATNGWAYQHIGTPAAVQDHRQKFVKSIGSGQVQIGENVDITGATYANIATQASTYATLAHTGTYTWAGNVVTVYCSGGHFLTTGDQTGLDFTSGSATDGIFTVTVLDPYYFTVPLAGSGTGGNVTSRPGITITFTAHVNAIGNSVYCDFTSGTAVDGAYPIMFVPSANAYVIKYPHIAALTGGNVTVYKGVTVTTSAVHNLAVGNLVRVDTTSGTLPSGVYPIQTVPSTTTFTINVGANIGTGGATLKFQIGYVPEAGRKIRIPNVIGRQCTTGARAANATPHATLGTRPEFGTTSAGYLDVEGMLDDWYYNIGQPYYIRMKNVATFDTVTISECATALELDNLCVGMYGALDVNALTLTSNFAGGTVGYVHAHRGNAPGTSDHAVNINYCNGLTIDGLEAGIIQYVRSTGKPINLANLRDTVVNSATVYNGNIDITTCNTLTINGFDICDRYIGYTNGTSAYFGISMATSNNVVIRDVTYGRGFTIPNVHPYSGLININACSYVTIRKLGTKDVPLPKGSWCDDLYGLRLVCGTSGNNNTLKFQEIFAQASISGVVGSTNSDKNVTYENVGMIQQNLLSTRSIHYFANATLNCNYKNLFGSIPGTTGQASVYGTHWMTSIGNSGYGRIELMMNEPTVETASQVTVISGTLKFNSSGGVIMGTVGTEAVWETPFSIKGVTGFHNSTAFMSGGTIGNYELMYALDTGSGYGAYKLLTGANLSAESVSASGFKMKVKIRTTTTNTTAITFLNIYTIGSVNDAMANPYPLDTITLTLNGLVAGSDIVILNAGTETERVNVDANSATTYNYVYETTGNVDIKVYKRGYVPFSIMNYALGSTNASLPVAQVADRNYLE